MLRVFLKLGLTSFGGPIAHLGYFRDEFVVRRRRHRAALGAAAVDFNPVPRLRHRNARGARIGGRFDL